MQNTHHRWVAACGGTEQPFTTRTGHRLQYMWCPATGEHAYYCLDEDLFVPNTTDDLTRYGIIW
jgi:hypothetical protein